LNIRLYFNRLYYIGDLNILQSRNWVITDLNGGAVMLAVIDIKISIPTERLLDKSNNIEHSNVTQYISWFSG